MTIVDPAEVKNRKQELIQQAISNSITETEARKFFARTENSVYWDFNILSSIAPESIKTANMIVKLIPTK